MATFYGSDSYCIDDLLLIDLQVTDPKQLIAQRLIRRLTTPRGALKAINDDPEFGWDVRQYINAKLAPSTIVAAQVQIQVECLKDEQVASAAARVTINAGAIVITVDIRSAAGPFSMTMNVSSLSTEAVFSF